MRPISTPCAGTGDGSVRRAPYPVSLASVALVAPVGSVRTAVFGGARPQGEMSSTEHKIRKGLAI